jgi:hypothetical protein
MVALMMAVAKGVAIHVTTRRAIVDMFMECLSFAIPMPIIEPTLAIEVDMGSP